MYVWSDLGCGSCERGVLGTTIGPRGRNTLGQASTGVVIVGALVFAAIAATVVAVVKKARR